jgi:hypothetical protein
MVKVGNIPAIITFFCFFLPQLVSPIIPWQKLFYVPLILCFFVYIVYIVFYLRLKLNIIKTNFFIIIIFQLLLLIYELASGRGFVILGSGGVLFMLAFMYAVFLVSGRPTYRTVIKGISHLYMFLLFTIYIELTAILILGQNFVAQLLPIYKTYNPSEVLAIFGIGGLNSILGGSQIAGMISLFSFLWFSILFHDYSNFRMIGKKLLLLLIIASIFMYLICMTGTTNLLFIFAIVSFLLFYEKNNKIKIQFLVFSIAVFVVASFLVYYGALFSRFTTSQEFHLENNAKQFILNHNFTMFDIHQKGVISKYFFILLSPILAWSTLDGWNMIFGLGNKYAEHFNYLAADNGFAFAVLLRTGVLGALLLLAGIFVACFKPIFSARKLKKWQFNTWYRLAVIFSVNSVLFLFSTIHYYQAIDNPGVYGMFALTLALSFYCFRRANSEWPFSFVIKPTNDVV